MNLYDPILAFAFEASVLFFFCLSASSRLSIDRSVRLEKAKRETFIFLLLLLRRDNINCCNARDMRLHFLLIWSKQTDRTHGDTGLWKCRSVRFPDLERDIFPIVGLIPNFSSETWFFCFLASRKHGNLTVYLSENNPKSTTKAIIPQTAKFLGQSLLACMCGNCGNEPQ